MPIMKSKAISVGIACPFDRANAFLSDPANWPAWAEGLGGSLSRSPDGTWTAQTPDGPVTVRFTPPNPFGVLDHVVILATGAEVHVPLRVIPNGDGCEVTLTLFCQPGMTDAAFESDAGLVRRDLERLKVLLEA